MAVDAASAVARRPPPGRASARAAAARPRIAVERVSPAVDGGRFAAKAVAGEEIPVEADIFADGHERLAAAVLLAVAPGRCRRVVPRADAAGRQRSLARRDPQGLEPARPLAVRPSRRGGTSSAASATNSRPS